MTEIKLFNRWDVSAIEVNDPGLKRYINLNPLLVPKTYGRNTKMQFWKSKTNIVERLMGKLKVPGHKGKKHKLTSGHMATKGIHTYNLVKEAFELIEKKLNKNPIEIFVKALENAAPREEITTIEYGGARYSQALECSPQRRVDVALRQMVQGAYHKCFDSKKKIKEALADEIISAYQMEQTSQAISKKLELERQADASR